MDPKLQARHSPTPSREPRRLLAAPICALLFLSSAGDASALEKIGPHLARVWGDLAPGDRATVWVRLVDKGRSEILKAAVPLEVVSERSRWRRAIRAGGCLVDATDLPVEPSYVGAIASRVLEVRQRSKWFNSVSVVATKRQILDLEALPCVRSLELVARFGGGGAQLPVRCLARSTGRAPAELGRPSPLDYGPSFRQLQQIGVPALHDLGLDGTGILIAHFDVGYSLLDHESLRSLHVLAAYDFVDHDPDPALPPGDPSGAHGTMTLSVLGGFSPGNLIGPAYGASYLLARTELDAVEVPAEEDDWIAAAEWADSLGADIISSSLKFLDYDPPFQGWTWEDMDGNTTLVTRAADLAAARGILVVNGAGNEGSSSQHNTLVAPADGDSVVAVGAVYPDGKRASFSSVGPTTSRPPRLKPDLVAPGTSIYVAIPDDPASYGIADGTSLSCPLVAGTVALLLSAHPAATPMRLREALCRTASDAASPSNSVGWGVVDALAAHRYLEAGDSTAVEVEDLEAEAAGNRVHLAWRLTEAARRELTGVHVQRAESAAGPFSERTSSPLMPGPEMSFEDVGVVSGRDYWYRLVLLEANGVRRVAGLVAVRADAAPTPCLVLHQPFEPAGGGPVQIRYGLATSRESVRLAINDVHGRRLWTLDAGDRERGEHTLAWERRDAAGAPAPRGVYFVRLDAGRFTASRKFVLLHR